MNSLNELFMFVVPTHRNQKPYGWVVFFNDQLIYFVHTKWKKNSSTHCDINLMNC